MNGIIFQLVSEIISVRGNIHHGNNVNTFAEQALIHQRLKNQTSDTSEPIDCNFNCHSFICI